VLAIVHVATVRNLVALDKVTAIEICTFGNRLYTAMNHKLKVRTICSVQRCPLKIQR